MRHSFDMPSMLADESDREPLGNQGYLSRTSFSEKALEAELVHRPAKDAAFGNTTVVKTSVHPLTNGFRPHGLDAATNGEQNTSRNEKRQQQPAHQMDELEAALQGGLYGPLRQTASPPNMDAVPARNGSVDGSQRRPTPLKVEERGGSGDGTAFPSFPASVIRSDHALKPTAQVHRMSSPPVLTYQPSSPPSTSSISGQASSNFYPSPSQFDRLAHRRTLDVTRLASPRVAKDFAHPAASEDGGASQTSAISPSTPTRRRASLNLTRKATRSVNSEIHPDEVFRDEDAAKWTEHIRQKRASKRRRRDDEDDNRVVVGTKVDQNHVNWVTAYNMLTGIRFTVSRTNAKLDRELTDADFIAKHKFSFDITGNELTPSAKYDFKFKDYAPWVFRRLRNTFGLDPADYLVSLTSKYILSELGSPGKSGSFFYFSRDYKYIIKTIHHSEHKFLRKVLREYFNHVQDNPNTLLSQFYGLHRVKIPYGRKIHFVVMNNLFPPHRDIHRTFDLKGSTVGRDFKETDLAKNPRATLKDLNWRRRDLHLELGFIKRQAFLKQMEKDVQLLQRLKIMDYSLLVGIHDLERGNEEHLRDKILQVFHPGGEKIEEPAPSSVLTRTPSRLENDRKVRELRQIIKSQRPIPLDQSVDKMPEELLSDRKHLIFYGDDGGLRATNEDNTPSDEIYYLGIIDCLTHYDIIKRVEHYIKGLTQDEKQISANPPDRYGDRFIRFISGITKSKELVERDKALAMEEAAKNNLVQTDTANGAGGSSFVQLDGRLSTSSRHRKSRVVVVGEADLPDRAISAVRSDSGNLGDGLTATLPVVDESRELLTR